MPGSYSNPRLPRRHRALLAQQQEAGFSSRAARRQARNERLQAGQHDRLTAHVPRHPPGVHNRPPSLKPLNGTPPAQGGGGAAGAPFDPLPTDAQYLQDTSGINRTLQTAGGNYMYGSQALNQAYGFNPTYGAGGTVTSIQIDPSNPYSRANALEQSYKQAQRTNTNQYAAAGQLYAGSLQNAQNQAGQDYNQNFNSLEQDYMSGQHGLFSDLQSARTQGLTDQSQAYLDAVGRALQSPDASEPVGGAANPAAPGQAGGGSSNGKPKVKLPKHQRAQRTQAHNARQAAERQFRNEQQQVKAGRKPRKRGRRRRVRNSFS
jgi:hypothetical protein